MVAALQSLDTARDRALDKALETVSIAAYVAFGVAADINCTLTVAAYPHCAFRIAAESFSNVGLCCVLYFWAPLVVAQVSKYLGYMKFLLFGDEGHEPTKANVVQLAGGCEARAWQSAGTACTRPGG